MPKSSFRESIAACVSKRGTLPCRYYGRFEAQYDLRLFLLGKGIFIRKSRSTSITERQFCDISVVIFQMVSEVNIYSTK